MSRFLKVIVNLVVLVAIVIAAALLVPPFLGVDTVMNANTKTETNLPVGSVAYGKTVKASELKKGDKIIFADGSSEYIYEITDMDSSSGVYEVKDIYNKNSDQDNVIIQKTVSKVIVTVPFIGYAAIALQSKEGLIIIGLVIVFLIILFILSELWRKDDDEDDEEDDEAEEDYEDEEDDDEEEVLSRREIRRMKKEEKRRRKLEKKRLKEEYDGEDEDEESEDEQETLSEENTEPDEFDTAMKDAMSSIAMGVAKVSEPETVSDATRIMPETDELEAAMDEMEEDGTEEEVIPGSETEEAEEESVVEEAVNEETINIEETAEVEIPVNKDAILKTPTVQELLDKARTAGENPEVKEDKENDITLLDYSDIL